MIGLDRGCQSPCNSSMRPWREAGAANAPGSPPAPCREPGRLGGVGTVATGLGSGRVRNGGQQGGRNLTPGFSVLRPGGVDRTPLATIDTNPGTYAPSLPGFVTIHDRWWPIVRARSGQSRGSGSSLIPDLDVRTHCGQVPGCVGLSRVESRRSSNLTAVPRESYISAIATIKRLTDPGRAK